MLLNLVATAIQQGRFSPHPIWFDHNALYHLLQALALVLLFRTARGLSASY